MPYWAHCWRCNEDGSYRDHDAINRCPECGHTGEDWREDSQYSYVLSQTRDHGRRYFHARIVGNTGSTTSWTPVGATAVTGVKRAAKFSMIGLAIPVIITAITYYYKSTHYPNNNGTYGGDPYIHQSIDAYISCAIAFGGAGALGVFILALTHFNTETKGDFLVAIGCIAAAFGLLALIITYFQIVIAIIIIGIFMAWGNKNK